MSNKIVHPNDNRVEKLICETMRCGYAFKKPQIRAMKFNHRRCDGIDIKKEKMKRENKTRKMK